MSKILIVEDDNDINYMIKKMLETKGYECVQAFSGTEGLMWIKQDKFDLVIIDLMLPGMDGKTLTGEIRKITNIPIIIASAKDQLDTKIDLLLGGADDYLTKPFEMDELLARVMVRLRRLDDIQTADSIKYKDITLDKSLFCAILDGNNISLTKQEFKILELLFTHPKKVFSKNEIYEYAWDEYYIGEDKTINVHISNIRKKLKKYTDCEYIETVWGIGFKLSE